MSRTGVGRFQFNGKLISWQIPASSFQSSEESLQIWSPRIFHRYKRIHGFQTALQILVPEAALAYMRKTIDMHFTECIRVGIANEKNAEINCYGEWTQKHDLFFNGYFKIMDFVSEEFFSANWFGETGITIQIFCEVVNVQRRHTVFRSRKKESVNAVFPPVSSTATLSPSSSAIKTNTNNEGSNWTCIFCNFENAIYEKTCKFCHQLFRLNDGPNDQTISPSASSSLKTGTTNEVNNWRCSYCRFENAAYEPTCKFCRHPISHNNGDNDLASVFQKLDANSASRNISNETCNSNFIPRSLFKSCYTHKSTDDRNSAANEEKEVTQSKHCSNKSYEDRNQDIKNLEKLSQNLKELYISGQDSDLTIKVKDSEFKAHKGILRSRSSVFNAMFSHELSERNSSIIPIDDCEPDVFEEFLLFIYSGRIRQLSSENACELYYVADKYLIPELKEECIHFLKLTLSIETICDVICLSTKCNEFELLNLAITFFARNMEEILLTTKWQLFMKENPIEANELTIKALRLGFTKKRVI